MATSLASPKKAHVGILHECPRCQALSPHTEVAGVWGPHRLRLECRECGTFLQWVSVKATPAKKSSHLSPRKRRIRRSYRQQHELDARLDFLVRESE